MIVFDCAEQIFAQPKVIYGGLMEKTLHAGLSGGKRGTLEAKKRKFAWAWLIPMLIYYTVLGIVPILLVIILSFVDWNGVYYDDIQWIGLENFLTVFREEKYWRMFVNSLIMGGSIMLITIVTSFFIALLMMAPIKCKSFLRTIWYIPCVLSTAVVSQLVNTILNPSTGLINLILIRMGKEPVMWTLSTFWMYFWIILISVWKGLGGTVILFMAGMSGIPQEMYEAADIDGATKFKKLVYITIPSLKNMFAFILITSSMGIFSIFEQVQLISGGGPFGTTMVIMYQIYNEAFDNMNVGLSSALSVIVLILVFIVTVLNMNVTQMNLGDKED